MPVRLFVRVMGLGFQKALGTFCSTCIFMGTCLRRLTFSWCHTCPSDLGVELPIKVPFRPCPPRAWRRWDSPNLRLHRDWLCSGVTGRRAMYTHSSMVLCSELSVAPSTRETSFTLHCLLLESWGPDSQEVNLLKIEAVSLVFTLAHAGIGLWALGRDPSPYGHRARPWGVGASVD